MLSQRYRLQKERNFLRIHKRGAVIGGQTLYLKYFPNRLDHPRLTVSVGLRISKKASERNRLKRLIREALKEFLKDFLAGKNHDIIVVVKKNLALSDGLANLKKELERCLKQLP